jgi:hypothetical protein
MNIVSMRSGPSNKSRHPDVKTATRFRRQCLSVKHYGIMNLNYILLIGAALNILSGIKLFLEVISASNVSEGPEDYRFLKLFVVGVAFTFASLYIYLFFNTAYVLPFVVFGASLKTWAFFVGLHLYVSKRITTKTFVEADVSNGIIAGLFWFMVVGHA